MPTLGARSPLERALENALDQVALADDVHEATLDEQALGELLDAPARETTDKRSNAFVQRILDAAFDFRVAECEQALTLAIAIMPPSALISDVLRPLLQEVGERWHRGEFAVSQERLISSCVRRHIGLILETYDRTAHRQSIVFATLPGERHELGLLMAALLCASRGFKVHYLGPDLPPEEIARFARETASSVVAVSVVLADLQEGVPQHLAMLATELGTQATIWVGGSGSEKLRQKKLPEGCAVLSDQHDLERRLELLQAA